MCQIFIFHKYTKALNFIIFFSVRRHLFPLLSYQLLDLLHDLVASLMSLTDPLVTTMTKQRYFNVLAGVYELFLSRFQQYIVHIHVTDEGK